MSKTALVVEFRIKPGRRDDFLKLMREHAAGSLAHSDGCLQFDVLVPKEVQFDAPRHEPDHNRVILYEVYRDAAARTNHRAAPYLKPIAAGLDLWLAEPSTMYVSGVQDPARR